MRWKDGILIAIISGIMGYLLHGYLSLGSLELPFINGIWIVLSFLVGLIGGSDFLAFIYDLYKKRKERKEQELQKRKEELEQERDKEQIYDWVYRKTEEYKGKKVECSVGSRFNKLTDPRFRSTEEIANALNMYPLEKVKRLCYINDKLIKMTHDDLTRDRTQILDEKPLEKWAIKEFMK